MSRLRIAPSAARARLEQILAPATVDAIEQLVEQLVLEKLEARQAETANRPWLTLKEAGEQLGCSADAVRMRIRRGRLEARTQGRRVYVSAASVESLDRRAA